MIAYVKFAYLLFLIFQKVIIKNRISGARVQGAAIGYEPIAELAFVQNTIPRLT